MPPALLTLAFPALPVFLAPSLALALSLVFSLLLSMALVALPLFGPVDTGGAVFFVELALLALLVLLVLLAELDGGVAGALAAGGLALM